MKNAAFGCQMCADVDCLAEFMVSVGTDDTYTVDEEMQVGEPCLPETERYLVGRHGGLVQIDPLRPMPSLRGAA